MNHMGILVPTLVERSRSVSCLLIGGYLVFIRPCWGRVCQEDQRRASQVVLRISHISGWASVWVVRACRLGLVSFQVLGLNDFFCFVISVFDVWLQKKKNEKKGKCALIQRETGTTCGGTAMWHLTQTHKYHLSLSESAAALCSVSFGMSVSLQQHDTNIHTLQTLFFFCCSHAFWHIQVVFPGKAVCLVDIRVPH